MSKTLIILNPRAGSGRAGKAWTELEPLLWDLLGELVVAITGHPDEVARHLDAARQAGLTRVISIGGDGTNHALVNALASLNERYPTETPMVYGNLPIGSGRDWARHQHIPFDIKAAAHWIANAQPTPTDVGLLTFDGHREHFLNIASAGLSGVVAQMVNRMPVRRPWTFLEATVRGLLTHQPDVVQVQLDGQDWYEGKAYLVAVANGSTFGHGMKIAPGASTNDGLFDVVLVKGAAKLTLLMALRRVYDGSHLTHPAVQFGRGKLLRVRGQRGEITLDLDGESARGKELAFQMQPGLLHMLG
ncbi:MAG TPA: diacylglycerol kinase family lipid kinase [Aggregatilineales bacterium]|nr:diacylglycerol kinase family lipid kinase [Aggregatilineales bacterium]